MTINPGNAASANEVLNNLGVASSDYNSNDRVMGYSFQGEAQNRYAILYDGDVTEFNTLGADWGVAGFNVLSTANYDTGNSTCKYDQNIGPFCATLMDDFEDASIDATKWTTAGGVSESGGKLTVPTGGTARTQGSGPGFDAKVADSTFIFRVGDNFASGNWIARITNGTTSVNVLDINTVGAGVTHTFEFYFDTTAETVISRSKTSKSASWGAWSSTVDISSVTSNWYVEFTANGTTSVDIYDIWYVQGAVTQTFQTNSVDHINAGAGPESAITLSRGIFTANHALNGATTTWSISSNDGTNFTTLNENEITTIGTPGRELVLKASIQTLADRPAYIYEYGVKAWD